MTTSEIKIHQLNLSYSAEQDRLLFRVGLSDNTELAVWLTLRMTKQLWTLLSGETTLPTAGSIHIETPPEQAVEQFKQEAQTAEALRNMDFSTQYQARKGAHENGTLLATALQMRDDGSKHLDITCLEGVQVHVNLTQEMILAICNMLQLSCREAGWVIGAPVAVASVVIPDSAAPKLLH